MASRGKSCCLFRCKKETLLCSLRKQETYGFSPVTKFFIVPEKALFLLQAPLGFSILKLPSLYFYRSSSKEISFLFLRKQPFVAFLRHLSYFHQRLLKFFFVRLRLRGLGYKFKRFAPFLFRFYFTLEMFTYFHVPSNVLCRSRKGRILLLSNDLALLKSVLAELLLLRKAGGYNKRGLWYSKSLLFLRKRRKI